MGSDAGGRSGKVLATGIWDSGDPGIRDAGDPGMADSRHLGLRGSRRRRYRALAHAGVPTYIPRARSGDRRSDVSPSELPEASDKGQGEFIAI